MSKSEFETAVERLKALPEEALHADQKTVV